MNRIRRTVVTVGGGAAVLLLAVGCGDKAGSGEELTMTTAPTSSTSYTMAPTVTAPSETAPSETLPGLPDATVTLNPSLTSVAPTP